MEVAVNYMITNQSDHEIGLVQASRVHGMRVSLIGPDGKQVVPYPWNMNTKMDLFGKISPGGQFGDDFPLAGYFPFDAVGEYRCRMTRRVYDLAAVEPDKNSLDDRGRPIDLTAPEFSFRVESLKHIERHASAGLLGFQTGDILDGIGPGSAKSDPSSRTPPTRQPDTSSNPPVSGQNSASGGHSNPLVSFITSVGNWWWFLLAIPVILIAWLGQRNRKKE